MLRREEYALGMVPIEQRRFAATKVVPILFKREEFVFVMEPQ